MALKTNLEAAREIIRQIRLRDISGIIVIDFIDMLELKNKRLVEKTFREILYKDKAKVQMGYISSLGLLEVSRQRLKPNFLEANTIICAHCNGKGVVRSHDSNSMTILKTIEGEVSGKVSKVNVFAAPDTVMYMLNHKREAVKSVESKHGIDVIFQQDHKMSADGFALEMVEEEKSMLSEDRNNDSQGHYSHKKDRRFDKGGHDRKKEAPVVGSQGSSEDQSSKFDAFSPRDPSRKRKNNRPHRRKPNKFADPNLKQAESSDASKETES